MKTTAPLIFDVRRGVTQDGPGIRTTVFMKGCPLHCLWCHNPESPDCAQEIGFYKESCIGCGECVQACPRGACTLENPDRIDRRACQRCGRCTDECPAGALRLIGRSYELEELMGILLEDLAFYRASGGGITLSGGEPTLSMEYCREILRASKKAGLHTAIQTNGFFDLNRFRKVILPYVDLVMFDVKVADPGRHAKWTGVDNNLIVDNLRALLRRNHVEVLPRIPVVPRFTGSKENLEALSGLLQDAGATRCSLLPYNPTWFHKARALGKSIDRRLPERMLSVREMAEASGIFSWARLV